jgi:hypothetical protein
MCGDCPARGPEVGIRDSKAPDAGLLALGLSGFVGLLGIIKG